MERATDERTYSPGLKGVIAGETSLARIDADQGRLFYRGYAIGELVEHGTYAQVAELLWTGDWPDRGHLACAPLDPAIVAILRELPRTTNAMDALRTGVSAWGAVTGCSFPPTADQARELTATGPSILAAFARLRDGQDPVEPDPELNLAAGFLYQLRGERPDEAAARALEAYFIVGAEHGFNASTFTARVIMSTQSDMASAVAGAIGALKGPAHGGAPTEVVNQLHEMGSPEQAERWIRAKLARKERLMGFGHRVYRAYDPARGGIAQGGRGPGLGLRLDEDVRRRGGDRPSGPARVQAGLPDHDQRRVLHRGRPPGSWPARQVCSHPRSPWHARRVGLLTASSRPRPTS